MHGTRSVLCGVWIGLDWIGFITSHVFPRYVNSLKNKNSRHSYLLYYTQGKPKTPQEILERLWNRRQV